MIVWLLLLMICLLALIDSGIGAGVCSCVVVPISIVMFSTAVVRLPALSSLRWRSAAGRTAVVADGRVIVRIPVVVIPAIAARQFLPVAAIPVAARSDGYFTVFSRILQLVLCC